MQHATAVPAVAAAAVALRRYKDAGGKSMETLEAVKHSKATLEAQLNSQRSLIDSMRQELGSAKVRQRATPAVQHMLTFTTV
jgi:hypothetical protein